MYVMVPSVLNGMVGIAKTTSINCSFEDFYRRKSGKYTSRNIIRRYFKHADNLKSVLVLSKIIKIGATR